ncbi:TIGR00730 family Rossman fold protein [Nitrospirillum sp. BR 11164]|uniref:LOG family protein n=1 Tax=Nitrospirillum sp. BR 11164 TaxID=3104324 RepID=UPI002AFE30DF|nr:TIGR00730 family Rossman fold protein [Nitrospirillum sp. BR 11164]MEA1651046.1 TIGR00730 family Rossman fold protein [Nitrospirillum sp. BR 11164]
MSKVRSVCVYCGSSGQVSEEYKKAAHDLGTLIGNAGLRLVYGGGRVGLMGITADAALAAGGEVVGIIPDHIQVREVDHGGLTELHVVDSMHTRKRMMVEKSDAFVVMPGGLGTLDEAFEIITWRQLGLHDKPVVIANIGGYWDPLRALLTHIRTTGFGRGEIEDHFTFVDSVHAILPALRRAPDALQKIAVERL